MSDYVLGVLAGSLAALPVIVYLIRKLERCENAVRMVFDAMNSPHEDPEIQKLCIAVPGSILAETFEWERRGRRFKTRVEKFKA